MNWKIMATLGLLLAALCFWGGWKLHPAPVPATAIVVEKIVEKVVTITTKPDGTIIRTEKEIAKSTNSSTAAPVAIVQKPKWAASAYIIPQWENPTKYSWGFDAARRVSDTGLWVTLGVLPSINSASLGLRVEF